MTLTYGFYNSFDGDRTYNAIQMSEFFDGVIYDGVFKGVGEAFKLTADGLNIRVGSGRAWFNHTWTKNDEDLILELPSPSNVNHRIDTLVLQVDTRIEARENDLIFVLGDPSVSPSPPVLTPEPGVYQYPIGNIYRARDKNDIVQSNITYLVGTPVCPFAANALLNLDTYDILSYKRKTVRGNHLGSVFTPEQKQAILNGSFEGLYLGDYWTFDNTNWRIVDFDYWYHRMATVNPGTRVNRHHIVIVPDDVRNLYTNIRPFTSARKASNCGWHFSTNAKNRCTNVANKAKPLFGNNNILTRSVRYQSTYSAARNAMNNVEAQVIATPMTEQMVIGSRNFGLPATTMDTQQLALYSQNERYLWMGHDSGLITGHDHVHAATWLANQYTIDNWVCIHDWAGSAAHNPSQAARGADHQIRPVFGVTGV